MHTNDECTVSIGADSQVVIVDLSNLPYRKIVKLQAEMPTENLPKRAYPIEREDWLEILALHIFVHIGESNVELPYVNVIKGTITFNRRSLLPAPEIRMYIQEFLGLARFGSIQAQLGSPVATCS